MRIRNVIIYSIMLFYGSYFTLRANQTNPSANTSLSIPAYRNHSMMLIKQPSQSQLLHLMEKGFDIVEYQPDSLLRIVATPQERDILIAKYGATIEIKNLEEHYRQGLDPAKDMGGYHTYSEVYNELLAASANPLARLDTIGYSVENRAIYAMKISDNVDIDEDEPEIFINGLIHAREAITVEVVLHFMWYLLNEYDMGNPEVTALIDSTEIWLAPVINPDGYVYNETTDPDGGGMWRKNRRDNGDGTFGVDLNRNWGFLWGLDDVGSSSVTSSSRYRGTAPFSEPETQALRNFINAHDFSVIINYHSYGRMYLKPWGFNRQLYTPDNNIFLSQLDTLHSYNGYNISQLLYVTNGNAYDWQYGEQFEKKKAICYVPEVGSSFWPPDTLIDFLCEENLPANLFMVREARRLWKRPTRSLATAFTHFDTLIDACSSSDSFSIEATFRNTDNNASFDVEVGYFDSMMTGDWFSVETFTTTIAPSDSFSVVMRFLMPEADISHDTLYPHTGSFSLIITGSDLPSVVDTLSFPVNMTIEVTGTDIYPSFTAEPTVTEPFAPVQFFNTSFDFDSCRWNFGDGAFSTIDNPVHPYDTSGIYTVGLVCYNNCYSDSIIYENFITVGCCINRGNVDGMMGPSGPIDVSDLTYLVDFLFLGGPPPPCEEEGNVDGEINISDPIDVADLSYLVAYLFTGGPEPPACF